jgi:hypothetical protein
MYLLSSSDCWVSSHYMKSQRGGGLFLKKHVSKKWRIFDKWIIKNCTKFLLWVYHCSSTAWSVVRIVGAHEESHPISVPEILALDNHAIVTAVAHRSADPLRHCNHLFPRGEQLQVQLRTWGSHSEPAKQGIIWMLAHEEIQIFKQNFNNAVKNIRRN